MAFQPFGNVQLYSLGVHQFFPRPNRVVPEVDVVIMSSSSSGLVIKSVEAPDIESMAISWPG